MAKETWFLVCEPVVIAGPREPASPISESIDRFQLKALAALIYEPMPRIWVGDKWKCPQCFDFNPGDSLRCWCGISRDSLPEFCER